MLVPVAAGFVVEVRLSRWAGVIECMLKPVAGRLVFNAIRVVGLKFVEVDDILVCAIAGFCVAVD